VGGIFGLLHVSYSLHRPQRGLLVLVSYFLDATWDLLKNPFLAMTMP
jgi:hypothetical protein